ncbi:hypothetical protein FQN54_006661 [Arachnomyces sp. PD_36]|nr:hypothetical protein FQN54_006661 [Arachnomyces sp. PD_36]
MSTAASPNSETPDSLWGRSKKMLPFLQRRSKECHDSKLGIHTPETRKAAHARRREQVRRAQRQHRERKEKYIKTLEEEYHRLQEEEMSITHGSLQAKEENEILRDIMIAHGIPLPEKYQRKNTGTARVSVSGQGKKQRLVVQMPSPQHPAPSYQGNGQGQTSLSPESQGNSLSGYYSTSPKSPQNSHPQGLDSTQSGVDFVLSLEHPCLGHTRPSPGTEDPSGHALTCQAPLLAYAPPVINSSSKWEIPAVELDRLFELALALDLEGEVTPIQAWSRIRNHPDFHTLDSERLRLLSNALLEEVQCFGFGATIDEETFNSLLNHALYPSRS